MLGHSVSGPKQGASEGPALERFAQRAPKVSFIAHSNGWPEGGGDFEFVQPPEAPIFRPTAEEFAGGPLEYVAKIKPLAEQHGICKIIPPSTFQPPFAVDVDQFRFTPRVQRLNELAAETRIKLNFLEQVVKFWDLQGSSVKDKVRGATLKIPSLERKALDLYSLHKVVQEEGGFEVCTRERKWSRVAARMGYNSETLFADELTLYTHLDFHTVLASTQNKGPIASLLRQHYERILFPYDVFLSGATIAPETDDEEVKSDCDNEDACDSINHKNKKSNGEDVFAVGEKANENKSDESLIEPKQLRPSPRRIARRQQSQQRYNYKPLHLPPFPQKGNKELKKLQVYGAGPKMPGFSSSNDEPKESNKDGCQQCSEDQPANQLIRCVDCDNSYHLYCLIPPLNDMPKGTWHCPRCIAYLVQSQPQPFTHEFGFAQSQRDYSLSEFGEMADNFKQDYFRTQPHLVPLSVVEKEFWRIVAAMDETVTVEYGADLHTNDYGSGFPTKSSKNVLPADGFYPNHSWNLNNLPILDGSVFKHINTNISGMIVPWMYVGMCFSTFCWHNEDHWSYSINYLHWGEAKSWYGVPGEHADTFERAMKRVAPELFESQPDLLHQLVTICNPNILMQDGVPIYRAHQQAGEFIVTFPRAYHAGFNQGLNFAEAVNFAPADWLPIGRVCVTHYSMLHRYPVFSHDELVCKMASDPDNLDVTIAASTYHDMLRMVEGEKQSRLDLLGWGVTVAEREAYELLPDDERQCEFCKTTCFLSALTCKCDAAKLVCIPHRDQLCKKCEPSEHTLRYRYTLDELPLMLHRLRMRAESFDNWADKVKSCLNCLLEERVSLSQFRAQLEEARTKRYPKTSKIYIQLQSITKEAEKCSKAAKDLIHQQQVFEDAANVKRIKQVAQEVERTGKSKRKVEEKEKEEASSTKRTTRSAVKGSSSPKKEKAETLNTKLTLEEFSLFTEEVCGLACVIPESESVKGLLDRSFSVAESITKVLRCSSGDSQPEDDVRDILSSPFLENIIEEAELLCIIDFGKQLQRVKYKLEEVTWLESCDRFMSVSRGEIRSKNLSDLNTIKSVIEDGLGLTLSSDEVNRKLIELQQLVDDSNRWLEKASELLSQHEDDEETARNGNDTEDAYRQKPPVKALEKLLEEVELNPALKKINLSPHFDKMKETVEKAIEWSEKVNIVYGPTQKGKGPPPELAPLVDVVEELVGQGSEIECRLEGMTHLKSTLMSARNWKERLLKTFTSKTTLYQLLHVLTPRTRHSLAATLDLTSLSSKALHIHLKKQTAAASAGKENKRVFWFDRQLGGNLSRSKVVDVYKKAEQDELNTLRVVREMNTTKAKDLFLPTDLTLSQTRVKQERENREEGHEKGGEGEGIEETEKQMSFKKFCVCGKEASDWMVQCQVCCEWFHIHCVHASTSGGRGRKSQQQTVPSDLNKDEQQLFVCVLCCRGRRPRLENVLQLLSSLHKLPVRIFEGDLLQCLAERAIAFQERVKKELETREDLLGAKERLFSSCSSPCSSSPTSNLINKSQPSEALHTKIMETAADLNSGSTLDDVTTSPSKHKRKSPLILRGDLSEHPEVELTEESKSILGDLLLESNLLEISIDETQCLWNLWLSTDPLTRTSVFIDPNTRTALIPLVTQQASSNSKTKRKLLTEDQQHDNLNESKPVETAEAVSVKKRKNEAVNKKKEKPITPKEKPVAVEKKRGRKKGQDSKGQKTSGFDLCSMGEKCLKPTGNEVDWVFCEGVCEGWFHQLCAGIKSPDEIAHLDKYYCIRCRGLDPKTGADPKPEPPVGETEAETQTEAEAEHEEEAPREEKATQVDDELSEEPVEMEIETEVKEEPLQELEDGEDEEEEFPTVADEVSGVETERDVIRKSQVEQSVSAIV